MKAILLAAFVFSAILGFVPNAGAQSAAPQKILKIYNNSNVTMFPIIEIGKHDADDWLRARFKVAKVDLDKRKYASNRIYRVYVPNNMGIRPGGTAQIRLPFYSQLAAAPDGTKLNQYIDWWNGGRIYLYDDQTEINKVYARDSRNPVRPRTPGPCLGAACQPLRIFASPLGLPLTDKSQLVEYTFADAITANGAPYPILLYQVGYNISSVDQVYLPVAMEPVGNPQVPYIGTVIPLPQFRGRMSAFLADFRGWPVYRPADAARPRIPGAYNVFANASNGLLTAGGATVQAMRARFTTCKTANPPKTCTDYKTIIDLFLQNYRSFKKLPCHDPKIKNNTAEMLKKIYGWVPFNEGCGSAANDLQFTYGTDPAAKRKFDIAQKIYIARLQNSPEFNPYVQLIHARKYLDMAAYAFSIDDAIGFQSYKGNGLIITVAGSRGLVNREKLDKKKLVTVTLGTPELGRRVWATVGICSKQPDTRNVDPNFPSFQFYPPSFPCWFTAKDARQRIYRFQIVSGPPNLRISGCTGVLNWCTDVRVTSRNVISAPAPK